MKIFIILTSIVICSTLITGWIRSLALSRNIIDIPNARSSHDRPTPRGGGIAIVLGLMGFLPVAMSLNWIDADTAVALTGASLVAGIGLLDDLTEISPIWRLLVHSMAAVWFVVWIGAIAELPLPSGEYSLGWVAGLLATLWLVWSLNLYNFMDGIDGIAGMEAVTVSAIAAIIVAHFGNVELASLIACIGAAALGFLFWNWPPASVFMGDVGSGFLGFFFAALSVVTHNDGSMSIWSWLILLGIFIVDSTVTLIRRLFSGEPIFRAHCSHGYQHAARKLGGHVRVTMSIGLINLFWLAPIAFFASYWANYGAVFVLVAWAPLVILVLRFRAGVPY